ncbi:M24 family metallopeptidase, partial [Acinetobacter baumannii]|uniref:M24 family metallopeptidase n=1 Tax=Acinetobacter baumannii TaxID=470 RepID=UPI0035E21E83
MPHHSGKPVPGAENGEASINLRTIGAAIQKFVEAEGFSVVREYCGHGIGRGFHEEPQVLHYDSPETNVVLKPG